MAFALEDEPFAGEPNKFNRHLHDNDQTDNEKQPHFRG
jgi:hypothetical protein